ncbi:MAG: aminopeptidase [Planctomycetota bacterium]|jgi:leucyl aminopeptidase (aminopeptidase T)
MDVTTIDIHKGAVRLVKECVDVAKTDRVLVVTDAHSLKYGQAVMAVASEISEQTAMAVVRTYGRLPGQNPPDSIAAAMKSADVVFVITEVSLVHCQARREASSEGVRVLSIVQPDDEMFARTIPESPFAEMKGVVKAVNDLLTQANEAHVTTKAGTDLWLDLRGRKNVELEHGYCGCEPEYRGFAAPPVIEANIAPVEHTARGLLVVDACQAALGVLKEPITFQIDKGKIVKIEGGSEAWHLEAVLEEIGDPGIYLVAELGIGLNPKTKLRGRFYEDESVYGTAHIGIGNNIFTGGKLEVNGHLDNVFWRPTIELDGKSLMSEGRLVYPGVPKIVGFYVR